MSSYTLLDIVQTILSAMDGDEVNSINDTVESYQVAQLLKACYYDIVTELGLPSQEDTLCQLEASGDTAKPVLMTVPTGFAKIKSVQYDNKTSTDLYSFYVPVQQLPLDELVRMANANVRLTSGIAEMDITSNGETFPYSYKTDRFPKYYSVINDNMLIFDAYRSDLETTLQKGKTLCIGWKFPEWSMTDTFVPDMQPQHFSYFINKAKARAFNEIKQMPNQEAASEARRQKIILQKKKYSGPRLPNIYNAPRYGRK